MISIALLAGGVSAFSPGVKSPLAPVVQARTLSPYAQMYPDAVPGARAPPEKSAAARAARRAAAAGQGPGPAPSPYAAPPQYGAPAPQQKAPPPQWRAQSHQTRDGGEPMAPPQYQAPPPQYQAPPPPAGAMDTATLTALLTEYCSTEHVRQALNYCNANPGDFGHIRAVFDSVRLDGDKLIIKLQRTIENRSDKLLDKLQRFLRERAPQLKTLQYEQGTTLRTIMLSN